LQERGPDSEPLRVGACAHATARQVSIEGASANVERADEVPEVSDQCAHDSQADPEVDPDQQRQRIGRDAERVAERAAHEAVDEQQQAEGEPDCAEVERSDPRVEVPTRVLRPTTPNRKRSGRRGGEDRDAAGKCVQPDRERELVLNVDRVSGGASGQQQRGHQHTQNSPRSLQHQ